MLSFLAYWFMSYFVDCACYRGLRWLTPIWDNMDSMNCILPHNYSSRFYPSPCQWTHTMIQRQCMYSFSAHLLWKRRQLGVWVEMNLLVGDSRVYLPVRCGVADVTFVGMCTCVCFWVHLCLCVNVKASVCLWPQGCTCITVFHVVAR